MDTGKHLVRALAVFVGIALLVAVAAFAKPQIIRAGNVFLKDNGGISPSKLPKRTPVPISAHIDAEIGTTDGTHIPAVRSLDLDFDKSFVLNAKGLPACRLGQLEARPTDAAKKACPGAIVGSGDGVVEVAFPEQAPFSARGPIVLFNGGVRNGTLSLFVHTYVSVPAPTAVVVPVKITRIHRGHFGIHAVAAVPMIAGGPALSPSSGWKSAASSPTAARSRASSPPPARPGSTTPKARSNSRAGSPSTASTLCPARQRADRG